MSIVAYCHTFVVGVDTTAGIMLMRLLAAGTRELIDTRAFPTTSVGISRALAWAARPTEADVDRLWVIEGAASYGAVLAGTVAAEGFSVAEIPRKDAKKRRGVGKFDALDARQIGAAALSLPWEKLRRPRVNHGVQ